MFSPKNLARKGLSLDKSVALEISVFVLIFILSVLWVDTVLNY